jgi:DNA-binding response OmpR family regulator
MTDESAFSAAWHRKKRNRPHVARKRDHMWPENATTCSAFFASLSSILFDRERGRAQRSKILSKRGSNKSNRKASEKRMADVGKEKERGQITSTLRSGPIVPGHTIQYYEDQHAWVIDHTLIPCSEPEYHCLKLLLEQANRCVPFEHFIRSLQETALPSTDAQKQAKMRVAHLVSNLRTKIWASGLDIVSVMNVGYILLSRLEESSASP